MIKLNWSHVVYNITTKPENDATHLLSKQPTVLKGGYGRIQGHTATVVLEPNAKPKHHKSRAVSFEFREEVAKALHNQVASGVLKPVDNSDWASPKVLVPKLSGKVRICADYKVHRLNIT